MSLKTQAKVLRVLQEQVTEPVGSTSRVQVDVRVLAATNKDLLAEIRGGHFREDLYFRLNVIPIFVPPLRERAEDIPLLVEHFVADFALEYGRRAKTVTPAAMARLKTYRWPGNVRELRNVIERVVIMAPDDEISDRDLAFLAGDSLAEKPVDDPDDARDSAVHGARSVRARLHPARAGPSAGQYLADRGSARRRAQQSVQEDEGVRNCPEENGNGRRGRGDE